jgi:quercetin 2,3-dioxygenase
MSEIMERIKQDYSTSSKNRSILKIVNSVQTAEGEGFLVNRAFPTNLLSDLDPFLLLDEIGPKDLAPREAKGAPDHPHRGFETVTYMLEGKFEHKDSRGNAGRLGPGDVQWMTAGAGVIHSELPEKEFAQKGGRLHGFQLWVNLPSRDKTINPRYQDIPAFKIPVSHTANSLVMAKVIAGEALGVKAGQIVVFDKDGEEVVIKADNNTKLALDVLFIAGKPLYEPIVQYGPFVMNKKEEILEAITDYEGGRMGKINSGTG